MLNYAYTNHFQYHWFVCSVLK